ncbi:MAG: VWA domain-containing protein [Proteobacteria bacterium]|nr:VWA domain-containing protein [Pseudomonadota bacterium]
MIDALASLHVLRPQWLWALAALPLLAWWWHAQRRRGDAWRANVDPHLLPHLVDAGATRQGLAGLALRLLGWTLAVLALAGPSWRQGDAPLQHDGRPLVVALDLSSAVLANDLPPSRLLQARAKLAQLLRERTGGDVALVAFSDDAYTVAPLTDDGANVALFLDALSPGVMPVDGHRPDRAIDAAAKLLAQAGYAQGDILLLTDGADAAAMAAAARAAGAGWRVSALGLGSAAGAAYRSGDGSIAHAQLDAGALRRMAAAGGGAYRDLTPTDADLVGLDLLSPGRLDTAAQARSATTRLWRDEGYWLLLPLLLVGVFAFRRGAAFAVLAACLMLPLPPAMAADGTSGTLWRRADQVEHARLRAGAEAYRQKQYDQAGDDWRGLSGADAAYNRGNALAKAGRYDEALQAYDEALRLQPGMADAVANRATVEAAKRQPPKGGGQGRQDRKDGQDPQRQSGKEAGDASPSSQAQQSPGQGQAQPQRDATGERPRDRDADTSRAGERSEGREPQPSPDGKPADTDAQRDADRAQRERMQQALQDPAQREATDGKPEEGRPDRAETEAERERRQATDAWLRRVPDDPGGLLRARFRLEYERRQGGRDAR